MNRRKIKIIFSLILILSLPFVILFITHEFIKNPKYLKKAMVFFKGAKYLGKEGVLLQKKNNDCGPAVLKMIFDYFKIPATLSEISKKVLRKRGSTMLSLKEMAELKGLKAEGWRLSFNDLKKINLPAIAFIEGNHFVVISRITVNGEIIVLDPAIGKLKYPLPKFKNIWRGEVLIFKSKN